MRRARRLERAAEIVEFARVEVAGQLDRERVLDESQDPARMRDHICVCEAVPYVERRKQRLRFPVVDGRPHPTVAIPFGPAAFQRHAVNHAVAEKPVARVPPAWIGAVPDIKSAQVRRNNALHGQIDRCHLPSDRREIALHPERCLAGSFLHMRLSPWNSCLDSRNAALPRRVRSAMTEAQLTTRTGTSRSLRNLKVY